MSEQELIIETINKIRPFLVSDGGDIEFIKYEKNIVYIKLLGACQNCMMIDNTIKNGIELAIQEMVPNVKEVVNIFENNYQANEYMEND